MASLGRTTATRITVTSTTLARWLADHQPPGRAAGPELLVAPGCAPAPSGRDEPVRPRSRRPVAHPNAADPPPTTAGDPPPVTTHRRPPQATAAGDPLPVTTTGNPLPAATPDALATPVVATTMRQQPTSDALLSPMATLP